MKFRCPKNYLIEVDNVLNVLKVFFVLIALFFFPFSAFSFVPSPGISETYVSSTINQNITWTLANSPYIVTGDIKVGDPNIIGDPNINSGTVILTIEAGVEVKFDSGFGLDIGYQDKHYGALLAQGTEENPIIFTSTKATPAPGDWRGISFSDYTRDNSTLLEHCIIEYAESVKTNNSSPSFKNCVIKECSGYGIASLGNPGPVVEGWTIVNNDGFRGIYFQGNSFKLINNVISDNSEIAVSIPCTAVDQDIFGNTGSGNKGNYIEVRWGGFDYPQVFIDSNITWRNQDQEGLPLIVTSIIDVYYGGKLTIEPGVVIRFDPMAVLDISGGALLAKGTEESPIIFTSSKSDPSLEDYWQGITFFDVTKDASTLKVLLLYLVLYWKDVQLLIMVIQGYILRAVHSNL